MLPSSSHAKLGPMPATSGKLSTCILALALLAFACDEGSTSGPEDALRSARLDLAGAIAVAQRAKPDGQVVEAEFEQRDGKAIYEVALLVDGEVHEVMVDPHSGDVIETGVDPEDLEQARASVAALAVGKIGITDAIAKAEREVGGQAHEVEVEDGVIEVRVLLDAGSKVVVIDLVDGGVEAVRDDQAGVEVENEDDDDDGEDEDD
jgi:uncharacterized membrane protein YkoI